MSILIFVLFLYSSILRTAHSEEKVYYIAAVEGNWDYAPSDRNLIHEDSSSQEYLSRSDGNIGHVYKKVMFREYTDATFSTEKSRLEYLGFIGPFITANVGDRITIHFKNKASRPYSLQPLALTDVSEGRGRGVNTGETHVYVWIVDTASGPRTKDPACITSLYYSNVDMVRDVNSGLVGIMKLCRTGTSTDAQRKHFALYLNAVDENRSWYLNENIDRYSNASENRDELKRMSKFKENNRKHSINGFIYGNIPPLSMCLNDEVYLHLAALGGDSNDVHSFSVSGHTLQYKNRRVDAVPVYPGMTTVVTFNATEAGSWLIGSQSRIHWKGGMLGLMSVDMCNNNRAAIKVSGRIRRYFIAAERLDQERSNETIFRQYMDRSFTVLKERRSGDSYLGKLGPLLTAEVGDIIKLVFYNRGIKPYSIYPRGVRMSKHYEGIAYNDSFPVARSVPPGRRKTYFWTIPESAAPRNNDQLCRMTYYTSKANVFEDPIDGLVGPILLCKEGTLDESGYPIGNERDLFLIFTEASQLTQQSEQSFNINGLQSIPAIQLCPNDTLDLHLLYIGITEPFINLHFNQNPVLCHQTRRVTLGITSNVQEMVKIVGKRKGEITVNEKKLTVQYNNEGCSETEQEQASFTSGQTLYIGIVEQSWNYADNKRTKEEWLRIYPGSLGPYYKKAVYKLYYTQYFGFPHTALYPFIGPLIKVTVGESIRIVLRNKAGFPFTLHADGVITEVEDRPDNRSAVNQGETMTFTWKFPESSGPADGDPPCIMRVYYSNIDKKRDVGSGLVGPLLICKNSRSTDKHSILFIGGTDETQSWFIDENLTGKTNQKTDINYHIGNNIYAINGYADGTFPDMEQIIPQSERYLHIANIGKGFHGFHLNGNYFQETQMNGGTNVIGMYPWTTSTVKVKMENQGLWNIEGLGNEDQIYHLYGKYFVGTQMLAPEK